MYPTVAFVQRTVICLTVLALGYVVPTLANPQDYPQFAQQQEDPSVPIAFIGVERVKQDLEPHAVVEQYPKMEGRQLIMVLAPKKGKKEVKKPVATPAKKDPKPAVAS